MASPAPAQNQWAQDGVIFGQPATTTAFSIHLNAAPDGHGGSFVAYEDNTTGDADVVVQWIDASGAKRWGSSGVRVASGAGNQKYPAVSADGLGGAYVAWQDEVFSDDINIIAQHVNSSGTRLWDAAGLAISSSTSDQTLVKAVSDGATGVVLVWSDKRGYSTTGLDLYAQRVTASGAVSWTTNGVALCTETLNQSKPVLLPDGTGGILAAWEDYRNGASNADIYAQRLNSSGAPVWTSNGVTLTSSAGNQLAPTAALSGSKLIVGWEDNRGANTDIYAQALNMSGATQWTLDGVQVCGAGGTQSSCRAVDDGSGGALIGWADNRSTYDIYAQRLNSGGIAQWTANGTVVSDAANYQFSPEMTADGAGGAVAVWMDFRNGSDYDLYAQHINASGTRLWATTGLPLAVKSQTQQAAVPVPDGSGGMAVFWQDSRDSRNDVYGQLLNDNIAVSAPASGALWAGDKSQTIQWSFKSTVTEYDHLVIKATAAAGDGFPISINASALPGQTTQAWTPGSVNSTTVRIMIQPVNDQGLALGGFYSPLFTVDSNPPADFMLTSPVDAATTDLKPTFQWQATTDALSGLDHYELWINGTLVQNNLSATTYTLSEAQKLSSGPYTWVVKAVDKAGLIRPALFTLTFTASSDVTAPAAFHLSSPANNAWTTTATPLLSWGASSDAGSGLLKYRLFIDGALAVDGISPSASSINAPALSNGSHTWYVVAVDNATNTTQSAETWTVKVDNVSPAAFHLSSPANNAWTTSATPLLSWGASSDAGSGLLKYQLFIDGALAVDAISPSAASINAPALSAGSHIWTIVAVDNASRTTQSTETWTVKVDNVPPAAFVLTQPANGIWITTTKPVFSWQASSDAGSGLSGYQLMVDGVLKIDAISSGSTSVTPSDAQALSEGTHTWSITARDAIGNTRNATASFTIKVDVTAPAAFSLTSPANSGYATQPSPVFSWQASSDAVSGIKEYQLWLDGVSNKTGILTASSTPAAAISQGPHTWTVKAVDNAANTATAGTFGFTADWTAPASFSLLYPASGSVIHTNSPKFTWRSTTDAVSGFKQYDFYFDGVLKKTAVTVTDTSATLPSTLSNGNHTYRVTASDRAGNVWTSADVTFNVQCNPPVITSSLDTTGTEDVPFSYRARATDPDGDPVTFSFQNIPSWLSQTSGSTLQGTPREGVVSATVDLTANDGLASVTRLVNIHVAAVNDPPDVTSSASATATEHQTFQYIGSATDPDNASLVFTYKNKPVWLSASKDTLRGVPPEGSSNFTFDLVVSDGSLKDSIRVAVTLAPVNDPPVFVSGTTVYATEDVEFTYTASATDPEGAGVAYQFKNVPFWMTVSPPASIRGRATEGVLNGGFDVSAYDGVKTTTQHVNVIVNPVDDPPVITSADTSLAVEDQVFSYTAEAFDPEGKTLTFTFSNLPAWLSVKSAGIVEGTPGEGVAGGAFDVTASDGTLTAAKHVTIKLTAVNDPPVITSAPSAAATEQVWFSYTAEANDPEGQPLSYAFQNVPAWLHASGQIVSGTPTEGVLSASFSFTVSDGAFTRTRTVALTIQPVNDAPVITSPGHVTATEHIEFTYTAAAADSEGDPLTYSFQNLSSWLLASGTTVRGMAVEGITGGSFDVSVSDGKASATKHVIVTVSAVNDAPAFTSPNTASGTEDVPFLYTAAATDPEGGAVVYTFQNYPPWLTPGANTLGGTPGEKVTSAAFDVTASDGILSTPLHVTVTIKPVNDPPVITSSNHASATEHALFKYTPTASDPENDAIAFSFINRPAWLTASASFISGTPAEGVTTGSFDVIASDGSLSDTLHVDVAVSAVNDPPQFSSPDHAAATEDVLFSYAPAASDPEGNTVNYTFSNVSPWLQAGGRTIGGTPGEGITSGTFDVRADDGANSATLKVTITVTPVNDPPAITSAQNAVATEHVLFTYTATASDPDNALLTYSFPNRPAWLTPKDNVISGTPAEGVTDGSFDVMVSDGLLSHTRHVTVAVSPVNDPPVFTSKDTASAVEDKPFSYAPAATDPENASVSFVFIKVPSWLTASGGLIGGTPMEADHDTTFSVVATDGSAMDTLIVRISVKQINDGPKVVSAAADTAWENTLFSYEALVDDADGPRLSVRFVGQPDWLIPSGTLITGTPPQGSADTSFKVIAWDSQLSDTLLVRLKVYAVNDAPRFILGFPRPVRPPMEPLRVDINLDEYVTDDDNALSDLSWSWTLLDTTQRVNVIISKSHGATIYGFDVQRTIEILFTVSDPGHASATDTLTILIKGTDAVAERMSGAAPGVFTLEGNYPNPFNPSTTIRYGIPRTAEVRIDVFDVMGRRVAELLREKQPEGYYEIKWNAAGAGAPSGLYLVRIQAAGWSQMKKMMLAK